MLCINFKILKDLPEVSHRNFLEVRGQRQGVRMYLLFTKGFPVFKKVLGRKNVFNKKSKESFLKKKLFQAKNIP